MEQDREKSKSDGAGDSPSPFASLPQWQPRPEPVEPTVDYECQRCHEPHPYTRRYWVPTIMFFLLLVVWRWENYAYCPKCMRLHLVGYLIPNLLVATLMAPLVLLTWMWVFARTFSRRRSQLESEYDE